MTWLKAKMPILFSPTFWGVTFSLLVFPILSHYDVLDSEVLDILMKWIGAATGVNIVWKGAKKIAGQ